MSNPQTFLPELALPFEMQADRPFCFAIGVQGI